MMLAASTDVIRHIRCAQPPKLSDFRHSLARASIHHHVRVITASSITGLIIQVHVSRPKKIELCHFMTGITVCAVMEAGAAQRLQRWGVQITASEASRKIFLLYPPKGGTNIILRHPTGGTKSLQKLPVG